MGDGEHKIFVDCDCGCSVLHIYKDDEPVEYKDNEFAYINLYRLGFYTEQDGFWGLFKKRVKSIWYALLGKDFLLYELVLNREKIDQLKKFIGEL